MDTQTRHALKHDTFVDTTNSTLEWIQDNRGLVIRYTVIALIILAIIIGFVVHTETRNADAQAMLNRAMNVYLTPLKQPDMPAEVNIGSFATAKDRADAAYPLFEKTAKEYGSTRAGQDARYFAGLTQIERGNLSGAQQELKQAADSNSNVAALAKMALANLAIQSGQGSEAVALYQQVIAHPTSTVAASTAQIALAEYYESNNPEQAKLILAKVVDQNKNNAAGQIAQQDLAKLK